MVKRMKDSKGMDFLDIKVGIDVYRGFTFAFCLLASFCGILSIVYKRDETEILANILLSCILLLTTIFMDKIVYALRLPTHHLFVSQNEITHKKGRKKAVYKIADISLTFHPLDFESIPLLQISFISSKEDDLYIPITKKQYRLMKEFLNGETKG